MKPQLAHGFLQPHGLGRTSAPHRRQVGRGRPLGDGDSAGEEGIGAALGADGGLWSMPAVHDGRIGQNEQLPLDAPDQRPEVTAGKVGAPDGALEQHIANPRYLLWRIEENDMARRVPRAVNDLQLLLTNHYPIALHQPTIRDKRSSRGET